MLLIIRQPLGAAALLSLLGSGLMSAELLACAQLTGQVVWASSWSSDEADDLPPGERLHEPQRAEASSQATPKLATATVKAVMQLARLLDCEQPQGHVLEFACISHTLPAHVDVAGPSVDATEVGIAALSCDLSELYGLGAEHG